MSHPYLENRIVGVVAALLLLVGTPALAQLNLNPPNPPTQFLDARRQLDGDTLRICISADSILAPIDRAVARAIGDALLLDVELFELESIRNPPVLDHRMSLSQTELFTLLNNECQAYAGFVLSTSGITEWMTITRPYLSTRSVFASADPEVGSLGDVPVDAKIGTRIGANVDIRFLDYNLGLPEDRRWRRVPYPNYQFLLDRLREGELDAILLWEPSLYVGLDGDPAAEGVYPGSPDPVTVDEQGFGLILHQRDAFLRTALDEAIAFLAEDGTLQEIIDASGIPGSVPR
jgi:polar amino acid transport system substrate-binding protein